MRRSSVEDHTNIDRGVELGKLLLGTDNCSLKIMEFISSEGFSIDVVFSLEYITFGEVRQEFKCLRVRRFS